jgi:hypothetical protein
MFSSVECAIAVTGGKVGDGLGVFVSVRVGLGVADGLGVLVGQKVAEGTKTGVAEKPTSA